VGVDDGIWLGIVDGAFEGAAVGVDDGKPLGVAVGDTVGAMGKLSKRNASKVLIKSNEVEFQTMPFSII